MKKIVIVYCVGLLLLGALLARSARAEVASDLSQADGLYKGGQYAQAEQPYLKVIRETDPNKPVESEAAFAAAKGLSLVYLATDRLPQAKEAIRQLLNRPTPHALHEIVEEAKAVNKLPQVHQVYQDMVSAQPKDPQAIWLRTGLAIASVHLGDDKAVEATLRNIVADHGSDDRAVEALGQIAWAYRKLQQYDKALRINQYTVDHWPKKDRAAYAQQGIVLCQIGLGDFAAADKALDVLVQEYGKDSDASKIVLWSGFAYQDANQTEKAYKIYELVVQNYPGTPEAVTAQLRRTIASVEAEDPSRMKQDIQTLLKQFAPTRDKEESLRTVADTLFWKRFGYANQPAKQDIVAVIDGHLLAIANYTLATWPENDWAVWAERDLATVAIERGDDPNTQAAVDRLAVDYADRKDTPAALTFLADQCFELDKFGQADQIYKYICDHWPGDKQAVLAGANRARVRIATGDDTAAEALFQKVVADYPNHPDLPNAILLVGQGYFERALAFIKEASTVTEEGYQKKVPEAAQIQLRKALAKWGPLTTDVSVSNTPSALEAQHYTILAYYQLDEYQNVLEHCAKLMDKWPDSERTRQVYPLMAKVYRQQIREGKIPEEEGLAATEQIRNRLLERYPDSPAAGPARKALERSQTAAVRNNGKGGEK
jgi:TolA-binding protein